MFARWFASSFLNFLIFGLLALGGVFFWAEGQFTKEGPLSEGTTFEVKRGESFASVAERLETDGIIEHGRIFRLKARFNELDRKLKFANYEVPKGASMEEVLALVTSGAGLSLQVTFPEGFSSFQIVQRLNAVEGMTGEITDLPLEGYLAPNTYGYVEGGSRLDIIEAMLRSQNAILDEAWANRAEGLPYETKEEALIAASIIEMETPQKDELGIVSSVIVNRLNKNIPLGMDSTTNYQITKGDPKLLRPIRVSDLNKDDPYNTRKNTGLPPTPIANPSAQAIRAALNPDDTDYLFFVADGSGGHIFARTLAEHNANKRNWQKIKAERDAKKAGN